MDENRILSRYAFGFAALLILALVYMTWETRATTMLRYKLISTHQSMMFQSFAESPFLVLGEMCYTPETGFCDSALYEQDFSERFIFIDWFEGVSGTIYKSGEQCYLWVWPQSWGEDQRPHPSSAYWITCPEIELGL